MVFLGHHILGDGLGYMNLVRDFFADLDGKLPEGVLTLPEGNMLKQKPDLQTKIAAGLLNQLWRKNRKVFTHEESLALFHNYRAQNPVGLFLAEESDEFLQHLRRRCKAESITVNAAVARAFVRALQVQNGQKPVRLGCAVSLRDKMRLPVSGAMGNFVSGVSTHIDTADAVPDALQTRLNGPRHLRGLQILQLLEPSLVAAIPFAAYGGFRNPAAQKLAEGAKEGTENRGFGVSNLGAQALGALSFDVRGVWFVPPAFPQNDLVLGILTCGDAVRFCMRWLEDRFTQTQIEEIYRDAAKELRGG